jgi:hypothetical protein
LLNLPSSSAALSTGQNYSTASKTPGMLGLASENSQASHNAYNYQHTGSVATPTTRMHHVSAANTPAERCMVNDSWPLPPPSIPATTVAPTCCSYWQSSVTSSCDALPPFEQPARSVDCAPRPRYAHFGYSTSTVAAYSSTAETQYHPNQYQPRSTTPCFSLPSNTVPHFTLPPWFPGSSLYENTTVPIPYVPYTPYNPSTLDDTGNQRDRQPLASNAWNFPLPGPNQDHLISPSSATHGVDDGCIGLDLHTDGPSQHMGPSGALYPPSRAYETPGQSINPSTLHPRVSYGLTSGGSSAAPSSSAFMPVSPPGDKAARPSIR